MSLISSIATIATAGAGGSETFWASSVRVRSTVTSGQAPNGFTFHAENESDGTIMQFMHSNSLASAENLAEAFIIARDPVDGSIQAQKEISQNGTQHKFQRYGFPFYNPSEQVVFVGAQEWWDPVEENNRNGYLPVSTDCSNGQLIAFGSDRATNGDGSFIIAYRDNKLATYAYDASTDNVPYPAGRERVLADTGSRSIMSERGSNVYYLSAYYANGNRIVKTTVNQTNLPSLSEVKQLPPTGTSNVESSFSNPEQCVDSSSFYLWCYNTQPNPDEMQFFQIAKSNLSAYKQLRWTLKSGGLAVQHRPYGSICCANGYVYFSSPIIYRGTGESYDSVMYAIYQIDSSTFQPVAAIGVRCDGGAREYIDSNPGSITRNAEETCLYLSFSHADINSRGADSHKLLKLPLDLSSLGAQSIYGGSTHGNIQIWDFLSTSTGATLPVESEIFASAPYLQTGTTYARTVTYESEVDSNAPQEATRTAVNSSLLTDLDPITIQVNYVC